MALFDSYAERAQTIQQAFRRDKAAILGDKALTDMGKRQKLEALEAQRQGQVAQLSAEAKSKLAQTRGGAEKLLELEGQKMLDARIKLFGQQGVLDMLRHSLETMDSPGIAEAYRTASTPFEREAIGAYGRSLLQMRARSAPTRETLSALEIVKEGEPKEVAEAKTWMRDIDNALDRLPELDRESYNNSLAERMGVDARYMDPE